MSGIYIKGMEMPKTCLTCDFHKCAGVVGDFCSLTKKRQFRFKNRPDYCPLVPVPEHGALIDRDDLFATCPELVDWYKNITDDLVVIPAEEGE